MIPDRTLLIPVFSTLLLGSLLLPTNAHAQLQGNWGVGIGVANVHTTASEIKSKTTLQPVFGRLPKKGWGFAFALNWFKADVDGGFLDVDEQLGEVACRPLMGGIAYTSTWGRLAVAPSLVAGPSFNKLKIDDRWDGIFEVEDDGFEGKVGSVGFAVRPGVTAVYALASHLAVSGFGGYIFNRPSFDIRTPGGTVKTKWDADGIVLNAGVIVTF